ncbi:entericidin A/B family lipoprotein [Falsirhodobacter xinxiangensis]|nr:entericidin A/B family lipoprotein [Rhodobacter xinxiangensis]MDH2326033.1 entericidin A/B family lipoprotein [Cereibacter flavus]
MRNLTVLPIIALLALAACETTAGAGRDLTSAGQAITNEANQAQQP